MRNFVSAEAEDNWPPVVPHRRNMPQATDGEWLVRVVCYTNAPQARLLLNDSIVGEMKPQNDSTSIIYWDIPYKAGILRAEGCDMQGNILSSYEIVTQGEAAALRISELLPEDSDTLHQLLVEVVDKDGNPVKSSQADVTCTVTGPAKLLGLENGNNTDMTNDRPHNGTCHRAVYRGRLVCYVQRTGRGAVTLSISSPGLQSCMLRM